MSTLGECRPRASALVATVLIASVLVVFAHPASAAAPSMSVPGPQSFGVGQQRVLTGGTAPAVADPDGGQQELEITITGGTVANRPTFTLDTPAGLLVTQGSSENSQQVVLSGTISNINASLDGMRFTAKAGPGSFTATFTVNDTPLAGGGSSDTGTVALTVTDIAPTLTVPANQSLAINSTRTLTGATAPTTGDADSPVLDLAITVTGASAGQRSTFSLDGTAGLTVTSGSATNSEGIDLRGTPAALDAALDGMTIKGAIALTTSTFTFTLDDSPAGGAGNTVVKSFTVTATNVFPTISAPTSLSVGANGSAVLSGALKPVINDSDSPAHDLVITVSGGSPGSRPRFTLDGTAGLTIETGSPTNSETVYLNGPLTSINAALDGMTILGGSTLGTFTINFAVDDKPGAPGGNANNRNMTVNVTNIAPTMGVPPGFGLSANQSKVLSGATAPTVTDADSANLEVEITVSGPAGSRPRFTLDGTAGLSITRGTATASTDVEFNGTKAAINNALNGMTIESSTTLGVFDVRFEADDTPGTTGGNSDSKVVQVTVANQAPTIAVPGPQTLSVNSSTTLSGATAPVTADGDDPELDLRITVTGGSPSLRPTFSLDGEVGLTIADGSTTDSDHVTLSGAIPNLNAALDGMVVKAGIASGSFTIAFEVDDTPGTAGGASGTASIPLQINPNASVPAAPTGVTATRGAGPGRASLSWTAPNDGGSAITGYRITPVRNGVTQTPILTGTTATTRAFTGLDDGVAYAFKVAAINAIGPGPDSAASPAVTPQAFLPFASFAAMVDRLYLDITGALPTAAQRTAATTALGNGSKTPGQLVGELRLGPDNLKNVDPVTRLYRAYFLRIPDRGGLDFWIAEKRKGKTLDAISQSFANSSEFKNTYGALSNRAFVELVYQNVLGRPGEAGGVTFWTQELNSGKRTRGRVMTGFSESNEYKVAQTSEVQVSVQYVLLLDRAPIAEFAAAVAALDAGGTAASLANTILRSDEYIAHIT